MSNTESRCISCRKPTTQFTCGHCEEPLCGNCREFLDEATFSFLTSIPKELSHRDYCSNCFANVVEPAKQSYDETRERSKQVYVIFNTQRARLPILKRSKVKLVIKNCIDRDETISRLAFQATQMGFNAIIDGDVRAEQIRNAGYQTSAWHGVGYAAEVDVVKLERIK